MRNENYAFDEGKTDELRDLGMEMRGYSGEDLQRERDSNVWGSDRARVAQVELNRRQYAKAA